MAIVQTWRWYGPNDQVTLPDIAQAGATGVVHALHDIPVGEIWPENRIRERQTFIADVPCNEHSNLSWQVVESLNIHESIKAGTPERDKFIEYYCESLKNLAACDIRIVCYNFMPVLDWTRTNLAYPLPDGSRALSFDMTALAAFDLFILKREGAGEEYGQKRTKEAEAYFKSLSQSEKSKLSGAVLQGIPGTGETFELSSFRKKLQQYREIDRQELEENMTYFLQKVGPVAEELDMKLAIHPDDPPFPLFGLPRIVSTASDLERICSSYKNTCNGFTFCTGSLSPREENNVTEMFKQFANRIHFVHLRNVKKRNSHSFYESRHLEGVVDMYAVMEQMVEEDARRSAEGKETILPFRPDHGHQIQSDLTREWLFHGYTAAGRLRGGAELRGILHSLQKQKNR